ncbi:hypothetical protein ACP70R_012932 [Stipagrostis hirtigluma subsp. patula]
MVERFSQEHQDAVEFYKQQRRKVSQLKKTIKSTKSFPSILYHGVVSSRSSEGAGLQEQL